MTGAGLAAPDPIDRAASWNRHGPGIDMPADMLALLAGDPAATARAAVALNSADPTRLDRQLALDADHRIRTLLTRKVAQFAPDLSSADHDRLQDRISGALAILVADEVVRVRAAIADVVKTMPDASRALILHLAYDAAVSVSEPVIRLSPLLTPEDLLALLAAPPHAMAATAIACRANLPSAVSDAIAATADTAAIRALLSNATAAIREATLDALVAQASAHAEWHEPLVRRPCLPAHTARALSGIVVSELLAVLARRADLDPGVAQELRDRLEEQLAQPQASLPPDEDALDTARGMDARGVLNETALLAAAQRGEARCAVALLAVACGVPLSVVDRAVSLRSAKGLVSLVWRSGFSMKVAGPIQAALGNIAPNEMLLSGPGGAFPLSVDEMRWQLEFLSRVGR